LKIIAALDSLKAFYIHCAGDSLLWFTTENALVQLNLKTGKVFFYRPSGNSFPIGLRTIVPLNDHTWWIRTRNNGANGLYIFDPQKREFVHHYECDKDRKGSAPMFIMDIFRGNNNEIFLGSRNDGLFQYDSVSDSFIHLFQFTGEQLLSHSNDFESIAQDKNGSLWIGTFKGLFEFDPVTKKNHP